MMYYKEKGHPKQNDESYVYEIVPDGIKYGIALQGKVVLHDMEWERAQEISEILNDIQESKLVL